jgi:hypothetical protein
MGHAHAADADVRYGEAVVCARLSHRPKHARWQDLKRTQGDSGGSQKLTAVLNKTLSW